MAAGTCLSLMANSVGDDIVRAVLPFVEQHVRNANWRFREGSVMALGRFLSIHIFSGRIKFFIIISKQAQFWKVLLQPP